MGSLELTEEGKASVAGGALDKEITYQDGEKPSIGELSLMTNI